MRPTTAVAADPILVTSLGGSHNGQDQATLAATSRLLLSVRLRAPIARTARHPGTVATCPLYATVATCLLYATAATFRRLAGATLVRLWTTSRQDAARGEATTSAGSLHVDGDTPTTAGMTMRTSDATTSGAPAPHATRRVHDHVLPTIATRAAGMTMIAGLLPRAAIRAGGNLHSWG